MQSSHYFTCSCHHCGHYKSKHAAHEDVHVQADCAHPLTWCVERELLVISFLFKHFCILVYNWNKTVWHVGRMLDVTFLFPFTVLCVCEHNMLEFFLFSCCSHPELCVCFCESNSLLTVLTYLANKADSDFNKTPTTQSCLIIVSWLSRQLNDCSHSAPTTSGWDEPEEEIDQIKKV